MIELYSEALIPIRNVPKLLPNRPNGKRIHISAIYRWMQRGVRGVRLEWIKVGGSTYTSREALQRFSDRLSEVHQQPEKGYLQTRIRQKQIEQASRQVEAILNK